MRTIVARTGAVMPVRGSWFWRSTRSRRPAEGTGLRYKALCLQLSMPLLFIPALAGIQSTPENVDILLDRYW